MNYKKIYQQLIERSFLENRVKTKRTNKNFIYYESHHIVPRCLGGSDEKENLVLLTAREHFICHKLLVEIYPKNHSIIYSYIMMTLNNKNQIRNFKISNREYARLKNENSKLASQRLLKYSLGKKGILNHRYGKKFSEEHKNKIRTSNTGKTHSKETIEKIKMIKMEYFKTHSIHNKGLKLNEDQKIKISNKVKKIWCDPIMREKYSKAAKNRVKTECPYCKKLVDKSTSKRWHFDNCKNKIQ